MAIMDVLFEFSDAQSVASSAQSTDILDWGSGMEGLEMGAGTPVWLNIKVNAAAAAGTSLTAALYTSDSTDIDGGAEGTNHRLLWSSGAIPQAGLTAGTWITRIPLPVQADEYRYIGLQYTASGTLTSCTVDAWLDHGPQSGYDTQVAASNI
jgi:hypothetical protein